MNREILRLAIPNIISNISTPLLGTVDVILMGQFSKEYLGAIGVGGMIFNFIYWNFGFLRMGTTGLTAQAYGRGSKQDMVHTLGRALLVGLLLAGVLLLLQVPTEWVSSRLMNMEGSQADLVARYFYIRIWAAPASLALFSLFGWYFGMQNAVYPLVLTIFINIVNIALSYYLVIVLGWTVEGVAVGTVVAQYAGLLLGILLFFGKYSYLVKELKAKALIQWEALRGFLTLNRDIFLRTLCLTLGFGFLFSRSAASGEMILAVNTILLQFLNWMSYGVDGFAYAAESLVGKYYGADDEEGTRRAIRYSFIWGMGLALVFALAYGIYGSTLYGYFTDQTDVIQAGAPYLWWMILLPIIGSPCYLWDGVYIGLTASRSMRNAMFFSLIIYLGFYGLVYQFMGNHGLWLALMVFLAIRGLSQWWLYKKHGLALR